MPLSHAVLWLDHHHADVIQFHHDEVQSHAVKDSPHDTRQHQSDVRTQHEFFSEVCDALAGIPMILVTGSHVVQTNFRHYVKEHRAHLMPQLAGWETVDHPTEKELVALAKTFFLSHDNMIGQHTMA
jgi:stalled ribosome rescue protein Dom34